MKQTLTLLADWANGIFAVLLASYFTGTEVLWWHFLVGIPLAMCPDLDAIPELLKRGKLAASSENPHDHRDGLHYPLAFLSIGIGASYYLGYWGLVFTFATTLHFLNDFYGTGWGIKLLWPFSGRHYKLLSRRVNRLKYMLIADDDWDTVSEDEKKLKFIVSWSGEELPQYINRWGDENWMERWYLSLNSISLLEYSLFLLAMVLAILTLLY